MQAEQMAQLKNKQEFVKRNEKRKGGGVYASLDGCVVQRFGKSNTGFDKHQKARKPGVRQRAKSQKPKA